MRYLLVAAVLAGLVLSGCSSHHPVVAASSAAAPVMSSTFTQQQLTALENELTTTFQQQLSARPGHPIKDAEAAVHETFPQGDASKIVAYAAQHFTLSVATSKGPGSARDAWVKLVVAFAVGSGGVTPSAGSSGLGPANIPGVTTPSPSTSQT